MMWCSYCGSKAHEIENCPKTWGGSIARRIMFCSYCGSNKHNINACPKTWDGNVARAWNEASISKDFIKD